MDRKVLQLPNPYGYDPRDIEAEVFGGRVQAVSYVLICDARGLAPGILNPWILRSDGLDLISQLKRNGWQSAYLIESTDAVNYLAKNCKPDAHPIEFAAFFYDANWKFLGYSLLNHRILGGITDFETIKSHGRPLPEAMPKRYKRLEESKNRGQVQGASAEL